MGLIYTDLSWVEMYLRNLNKAETNFNIDDIADDLKSLVGLSVQDDSSEYADIDVYNTKEIDYMMSNINERIDKITKE